jgi:hypothetical protein
MIYFRITGIEFSDISITVFVIQAGFDVLTATTKSTVFWLVIRCSSERFRRFGAKYCLHFDERRVK